MTAFVRQLKNVYIEKNIEYTLSKVNIRRRPSRNRSARTYVHRRTEKPKIRNVKPSDYVRFRLTDGMRFENVSGAIDNRSITKRGCAKTYGETVFSPCASVALARSYRRPLGRGPCNLRRVVRRGQTRGSLWFAGNYSSNNTDGPRTE